MLRSLVIILVVLIIIGLAAVGVLNYFYLSMLEPVDPAASEDYVLVEIPSGAGSEVIADILEREGLIQNSVAFRYYVRSNNLGHTFMAGTYQLNPAMDVEEIVNKLQSGDVYAETTWFTVPEGYTLKQMADRLEEEGLIDSTKFLELADDPTDNILDTFTELRRIEEPEIEYLLEGYLYPDTYEIYTTADEEEIIKLMLGRMNRIIDEESKNRADQLGLTIHEVLTIASLIEREAAVAHERDRISGVIHNRLEIGQMLQIDATIQYILGETKEFLTYADLEIPSPYNTYQYHGLPPGPIAAPGQPSIEAALYPEDTEYFYYNYKYDDTGEHYFSETYEEHLENVRRAEENLD